MDLKLLDGAEAELADRLTASLVEDDISAFLEAYDAALESGEISAERLDVVKELVREQVFLRLERGGEEIAPVDEMARARDEAEMHEAVRDVQRSLSAGASYARAASPVPAVLVAVTPAAAAATATAGASASGAPSVAQPEEAELLAEVAATELLAALAAEEAAVDAASQRKKERKKERKRIKRAAAQEAEERRRQLQREKQEAAACQPNKLEVGVQSRAVTQTLLYALPSAPTVDRAAPHTGPSFDASWALEFLRRREQRERAVADTAHKLTRPPPPTHPPARSPARPPARPPAAAQDGTLSF